MATKEEIFYNLYSIHTSLNTSITQEAEVSLPLVNLAEIEKLLKSLNVSELGLIRFDELRIQIIEFLARLKVLLSHKNLCGFFSDEKENLQKLLLKIDGTMAKFAEEINK